MDNLNFLLENGMTLEEIHRLMDHDDLTVDEIAESAQRMLARGDTLNSVQSVHSVQPWAEPLPFDSVKVPTFPLEALPEPLAAMTEALAEYTQTPESMGGTLVLGALAAAVQDKYEYSGSWRETLSLYVAPISPPGTRKSAVFQAVTAPLSRYEAEKRKEERSEVAQSRARVSALEKAKQATETRFASGKATMDDVLNAATELEEAQAVEKHEYRLLANDATPERLVDLMSQQDGSLTVVSTEGGLFDQIAGRRYDNGGGLDVYLQAHDGDKLVVDRIGRPGNEIERPHLSILLTVQPDVVRGLMSNATLCGRGLVARFLFVKDDNMVGRRKIDPPPIPEEISRQYTSLMYWTLAAPYRGDICPNPEADNIRKEYQAYIETKLGTSWEYMADFGGKLVGTMCRIAALLHVAQTDGDPTKTPISAETMAAAVKLAEFYGLHAEAVYKDMGADDDQSEARYLWRHIQEAGKAIISKRDLYRLVRGRFKRAADMEAPLQELIDMGYIREEAVEREGAGRKASPNIIVNPLTLGHNGQNGQNSGAA